jgi:hypothetical protein
MRLWMVCAGALALTGCSEIMIGGRPLIRNGMGDVDSAAARHDWAALDTMCKDTSRHTDEDAHKAACKRIHERDIDAVVSAPCEQKWEVAKTEQHSGTVRGEVEVAKSFFACNLGEKLVGENGGWVSVVGDFDKWEGAGLPVTETVLHVLASPQGAELRVDQITGLVDYAVRKQAFSACDPILARFQNAAVLKRRAAGRYFVAGKCPAAVPMFEGMLVESDATVRQNACWSLGEIGGRTSLQKLGILAESDAAFEVVDLNKVYFVRDTCRAAAGKIRLRNTGAGGRMAAR